MLEEGIGNSSHEKGTETTGEQAEQRGREHSAEGASDLVSQTKYPTHHHKKSLGE